jgi:hypothetical protein
MTRYRLCAQDMRRSVPGPSTRARAEQNTARAIVWVVASDVGARGKQACSGQAGEELLPHSAGAGIQRVHDPGHAQLYVAAPDVTPGARDQR